MFFVYVLYILTGVGCFPFQNDADTLDREAVAAVKKQLSDGAKYLMVCSAWFVKLFYRTRVMHLNIRLNNQPGSR